MQSITITKDEFMSVVAEVVEEWDKKATDHDVDKSNPMASLMMMLQNMAFASELANKLFNNTEDN